MDNKTNINLYYVFLIHSNLYSQTPKFQSQEVCVDIHPFYVLFAGCAANHEASVECRTRVPISKILACISSKGIPCSLHIMTSSFNHNG